MIRGLLPWLAEFGEKFGVVGRGDPRAIDRLLLALLAVYAASFFAFYPEIATNDDEAMYLRQAELVLRGEPSITQIDPTTRNAEQTYPSTYAPGTAYLMAPFVALFGWRGAFLVPLLGLAFATWLTARWIREAGGSPFFALILLGFPPTLVMARVAMSDVPSAAVAALGMWLFWRGIERAPTWWLGAGFVAGASFVLRATNPVLFVPLFAGTVLRRERKCWALVVGGVAGLGARALAMHAYFGSALYERSAYHLDIATIWQRLPLYLLGLLVFVPGGLALSLAYRGRRRPEIVATVALFFTCYLLQTYSTWETSFEKWIVLGLRYLIPLLPVMAFAMAESTPRLFAQLRDRARARGGEASARRFSTVVGALALVWVIGIGAASAAVHPLFHGFVKSQAVLKREIEAVLPGDRVFITNWMATRKFTPVLSQKFVRLERSELAPHDVEKLIEMWGEVWIVLLRRTDSEHWRADALDAERWLAALRREPELVRETTVSPTMTLRVWKLDANSKLRR